MAGSQMLIAAVQIGGKSFQRAIWGWDWGSQGEPGPAPHAAAPSRENPLRGEAMGDPRVVGGCGDGITRATPLCPGVPGGGEPIPTPRVGCSGWRFGGGSRGGQPRPSAPIGSKFGGAALIGPPGSHPPQIPQRAAIRGHGRGRRRLRRPRGRRCREPGAPERPCGLCGRCA